jgi:hypothetical protein
MMKSPEQVLMRQLTQSPEVARLVGLRVFPVLAPVSASLPFVVYQRSQIERNQTLASPLGLPRVSVQFDVYAATYEETRQLADAMRVNLDGWTGSAYGVVVSQTSLESERDGFVQLDGSELPPVYQIIQIYDVWWQETN